jgi:hypothetical protein
MSKQAIYQDLGITAAHIISGVSSGYGVRDAVAVDMTVNVTAVSGTNPTLDIDIQTAAENDVADANWITVKSFTQIVTAGTWSLGLSMFMGDPLRRHIRVSYTIGGATPSFTFSAYMNKHVL